MAKGRKKYNDCWMYILLLSTIVILAESITNFNISLMNVEVTFAIFLIPVIIWITNYITKVYGFRRTLGAILISALSMILFVLLMSFAVGKQMDIGNLTGGILGYLISQLVNAMIYKFLLVNTNSPYILVLLNYIFAFIVFYMVYTLVHLDMMIPDKFWKAYFVTLGIQTIMSIGFALVDKKIKVGMSKDD